MKSDKDIADLLMKLYEGALEYTHSNEGERSHANGYRKLDHAVHDLAFWAGDDLPKLLRRWTESR